MTDYYTENLGKFGFREIRMLKDILVAWVENGLPEEFSFDNVRPAMNMSSGYVFLVNDDYQVAMMNGDTLELFHTLPYGGKEGFLSDLIEENDPDDLHEEDVEYVLNAADMCGFDLQPPWLDRKIDNILDIEPN
ncbi:hypothetical protein KTO58_07990 [Chitinophaga pendula]|uniref:hypothetical protein n=1 Tax=Chitinophaga TaxID=79328 RepID=UPI0012FD7DCC|nr:MULTISPECIES: hypothetical protein [Chitinophaga]UCJ09111.1 hypothetical protein KTO58_07990 [Chitinophaga pendula]